MKYTITIGARSFNVEIVDIHARPVLAIVDGTQIEVWPEIDEQVNQKPPYTISLPMPAASIPSARSLPALQRTAENILEVRAPIPGTILSLAIQPGDEVSPGQELCILEAMKMKNTIRSPRSGMISAVKVSAGDVVRHHDILIEFASKN